MRYSLGIVKKNIFSYDILLVANKKGHHHSGSHQVNEISVKKPQTAVELMAGT